MTQNISQCQAPCDEVLSSTVIQKNLTKRTGTKLHIYIYIKPQKENQENRMTVSPAQI